MPRFPRMVDAVTDLGKPRDASRGGFRFCPLGWGRARPAARALHLVLASLPWNLCCGPPSKHVLERVTGDKDSPAKADAGQLAAPCGVSGGLFAEAKNLRGFRDRQGLPQSAGH